MIKNSTNIILQGKGGVGKSLIANFLANYFIDRNIEYSGVDTDPNNATFQSIDGLNATHINIIEGGQVNRLVFDGLFERILTLNSSTIIDNGSPSFLPLVSYFDENEIVNLFMEEKIPLFIHSVLVNGQDFNDTIQGLASLCKMIENTDAKIVLWLNEFRGEINLPKDVVNKFKDKVVKMIKIQKREEDTFGSDMQWYTKNKQSLNLALQSTEIGLMAKRRLKRVFTDIYSQLDDIYLTEQA